MGKFILTIIPVLPRVRGANPSVEVTLEQFPVEGRVIQHERQTAVRSTFNIKLQVDVGQMDEKRRDAYIELVKLTAKQYYAQAAMIASSTPIVSITSIDRRDGEMEIPLFDTPESEEN